MKKIGYLIGTVLIAVFNKNISNSMENFDSKIKDIGLAEWGRKEIEIAQVEMPGKPHILLTFNQVSWQPEKNSVVPRWYSRVPRSPDPST